MTSNEHPTAPIGRRTALEGRRMLVCYLRTARRTARVAAEQEVVGLLHSLDAAVERGGPLSERGGVIWVSIPADRVEAASGRLPRLGYSEAVDIVLPDEEAEAYPESMVVGPTRWRRRSYELVRLYQEDSDALGERAPDRRPFIFEGADGEGREVHGYRGSNDPLTHRALPVPDARLLVNLVAGSSPGVLLDPFAGAGGVVLEAVDAGWDVVSIDIDPAVRFGLAAYGASHLVADARKLPVADEAVAAVATEPPYDPSVGGLAADSIIDVARVLRRGGQVAMLCAAWQAEAVRSAALASGLRPCVDAPVNRKGLDVVVLSFRK